MIALGFQWLLTYLVHSTVLLLGAALLDRRRRLTAHGSSSGLWRLALFGGFVSATLQPALRDVFAGFQVPAASGSLAAVHQDPFTALALPPLQADAIDIAPLLEFAWLAVAVCRLACLFARLVRMRRELASLPMAASPELERNARELARRARIAAPRLRIGPDLRAPLVAPGRIICIPAWMLDRYAMPRLNAALAHEIAHLRRHDDLWRLAGHVAAVLGWLQPLNRLALRRLAEAAELDCDAWAASATGLRHELACALEDCAIRLDRSRPDMAFTLGMAANRFTLLERVTKLLEDPRMDTARIKRTAWWSGGALLGIAVVGSFIVVSTLDDDVPPRWLAANGLYQSLQNIEQDARVSRSLVSRSSEQYVYIRFTDNFSLEERAPAQSRAGSGVISETRNGVTRSLRYERGTDGTLRRTYKINGRVHAFGTEDARWLETMLPVAAPVARGS